MTNLRKGKGDELTTRSVRADLVESVSHEILCSIGREDDLPVSGRRCSGARSQWRKTGDRGDQRRSTNQHRRQPTKAV